MIKKTTHIQDSLKLLGAIPTIELPVPEFLYIATENARCPKAEIFIKEGDYVKLGQKIDDPLEMYLSDMYTVFVNLARIPSISIPAGKAASTDNMPVGIQFAGPMFSEAKLLQIAQAWEDEHPGCGIPLKQNEA